MTRKFIHIAQRKRKVNVNETDAEATLCSWKNYEWTWACRNGNYMSEFSSNVSATLLIWDATRNAATSLLKDYARFSLLGKGYPALIKHDETSIVDGLLFCPQDKFQRQKLDDFEGEMYAVIPVQVVVVGEEGRMVDANIYLWNGERNAVSVDHWDLDTFIRERLDDWIEFFAGMELVGDDADP